MTCCNNLLHMRAARRRGVRRALDDEHYLLVECRSEVDINRAEINKRETEQMNRSGAWFHKHYGNATVKRVIVHTRPHRLTQLHPCSLREDEVHKPFTSVRSFLADATSMFVRMNGRKCFSIQKKPR
jgi:hypothetical protein